MSDKQFTIFAVFKRRYINLVQDLKKEFIMKFNTLTRVFFFSSAFVFSFLFNVVSAQSIPSDLGSLSDSQLQEYMNQAQSQGYTIEQIKTLAQLKGVSPEQIAQFESRVATLNNNASGLEGQQINNSLDVDNATPTGFTNNVNENKAAHSHIFGLDYFNNPNISFTPNLNIATPENYQLGPGDELVINIWGAAENTYNVQVNREGVLRLPNVGPVFVNGTDMEAATEIVKNKLKRVYGGINAPDSSPYKVFVNISLSQVRSIQVNIIGEIKVPGTYTISSLSTVLNGLYASGGPTSKGTLRQVKLVRNGKQPVFFDVYKYLLDGSQEGNVSLRDNDLIIVSPYLSRVEINGAVKRTGSFELKPNENFSDLLRYASGFNARAFKEKFSLQRIEGDRMAIKELEYNNIISEKLQNGDIIDVSSIIDQVENSVSIEGPLYRPGRFEFKEGLTVKDLIEKASGVTELAYEERGLIYRGNNYSTQTIIPFKLSDILNNRVNISLENNDRVRLFGKSFLNKDKQLSITGGVGNPGDYEYFDSLTLEDLILIAGGLTDSANPSVIDVFRKINDDDDATLAQSFQTSIDGEFDFSNTSSFELKPGDIVAVRLLKGINDRVTIAIEGEVNYPGSYAAGSKNERISDFITKAGGLSNFAFEQGATLIRKNPFYKEAAQDLINKGIKDNSYVNLNNQKEYRVGIDLSKILKNPSNGKENIVIKDGDRIIIPSIKSTIKTEGEVLIPSLIREENNLTFKDYINKSGGFTEEAIRRKSFVIYPNGDIASTKTFLFFKNYPKLMPGSIVVVPKKEIKNNTFSAQEALGLTSGFGTLALVVDRLFRN